ncbi:immunity 49 family protein [Reichenbachiella ulvae]|uniref:Immunity 49 family protein n=1 Tax=Reichenbachiella ulvae TaxID=2980104 RepID=A0ABT3CYK5_9BACT|nr:immunity 49 family protein [Reichenbachiella ulvae]MCV9388651.1 immunity 49 family protein [Reichenbachiella ulvae]
MERNERLIETIKSNESVREGWLQAFSKQISDEDLKWGAGIVWYDHQRLALKSYFIEDSLTETKIHFYTCGRLDEYLINHYNDRILEYGMAHISYALLSDHRGLIRRYADLAHPGYDKITKKGSIIYAMQLAIKDRLDHGYVDILDALSQKKGQTAIQPDVRFFRALIEKDKPGCEAAINELLTPKKHKQRNKYMELVNEFISHPAIGYTKLAWLKGVEVVIDNPLVPNSLLPINPNESYAEEYEFLKQY